MIRAIDEDIVLGYALLLPCGRGRLRRAHDKTGEAAPVLCRRDPFVFLQKCTSDGRDGTSSRPWHALIAPTPPRCATCLRGVLQLLQSVIAKLGAVESDGIDDTDIAVVRKSFDARTKKVHLFV